MLDWIILKCTDSFVVLVPLLWLSHIASHTRLYKREWSAIFVLSNSCRDVQGGTTVE